eukprot:TRINITY_DN2973_c0_g1_i3.p1 TRINITY_DN2973_c0_g1~~TRINITY_DN2973_c0_g1_i3.p1  ORF type:complete len:339 (+),score=63.39 TRINITY_DN2973_c0_g1_i3:239-1255(+)
MIQLCMIHILFITFTTIFYFFFFYFEIGVCGNGLCEIGERCLSGEETNVGCCIEDCPLIIKPCPAPLGSSLSCGGSSSGICNYNSGECSCFTAAGFTGIACEQCNEGWFRTAGGKCQKLVEPSCFDEIKNGLEEDIDCGGLCGDCAKINSSVGGAMIFTGTVLIILIVLPVVACMYKSKKNDPTPPVETATVWSRRSSNTEIPMTSWSKQNSFLGSGTKSKKIELHRNGSGLASLKAKRHAVSDNQSEMSCLSALSGQEDGMDDGVQNPWNGDLANLKAKMEIRLDIDDHSLSQIPEESSTYSVARSKPNISHIKQQTQSRYQLEEMLAKADEIFGEN